MDQSILTVYAWLGFILGVNVQIQFLGKESLSGRC